MKTPFISHGKHFLTVAAAIGLSLSLTNCKKDKDDNNNNSTPTVTQQDPLSGYLSATGFNQAMSQTVNGYDYEFGIKFIPAVNGKMTAIVTKIPDVNANMKVTIWDAATMTILRTELVQVTSSGVDITKNITPLELTAGTEYMISMNSNDWYSHSRTDASDATYPVAVQDISITGYAFYSGADQVYPDTPISSYYAGDLSFKFQKN